ncbi:Crp/Fnr family transcriptional regulator [Legionella micdadei]|uniref:Cyclic nucleotide-binding domain protein n=1 Tax=Legionella micdadei TaxID=451 RepID=A0A098GFY7_LEGMI|nr:cyclic nucleotide-binding domain-containing protein [Legionella micdadei]ARG97977.1 cyclic nucleotide-binding protein [Legionella micdadei]ARG99705.1 cyclic nucleotide-binding protein [Legionella micdadei]KTD30226.1 cyclic nucleotide-binding protein [Legionella micdadei]NSL19232.1 cyclic nucleotide-binding domain-containing protein [Legionella micdadei]CEG60401.1 Cyclic nucleotide-binding domain protein [Legionella micdadei]
MEKDIAENLELFNFLKKLEFFSKLSKNALWPLVDLATIRNYSPNEIIINEGDNPVGIFILRKGTVQVFKTLDDGKELIITTLSPGQIIGEISVIDKLKTTASVRALDSVECVFISEWDFTTQIHAYPEIALELLPILAARIRIMHEKMI